MQSVYAAGEVDHRTDLWSLAVTMFECFSGGSLPFSSKTNAQTVIWSSIQRDRPAFALIAGR